MNGGPPRLTVFMPGRIAALPTNKAGYPIPFFVADIDGVRDFRVASPQAFRACLVGQRCWICGQRRTQGLDTFVLGPMCAINRTTAEPPSHPECAEYAVRACPFMVRPDMVRRERGLPADLSNAGIPILRNPGVALLWTTGGWSTYRPPVGTGQYGVLFELGDPIATSWWCQGQPATRAEVCAAIDSGLPLLREQCETPDDHGDLDRMHQAALAYLPPR